MVSMALHLNKSWTLPKRRPLRAPDLCASRTLFAPSTPSWLPDRRAPFGTEPFSTRDSTEEAIAVAEAGVG